MNFNKDVVRNCPGCNSTNIQGSISIKNGCYSQKIQCKDCPYTNNRPIGTSENAEVPKDLIDDE